MTQGKKGTVRSEEQIPKVYEPDDSGNVKIAGGRTYRPEGQREPCHFKWMAPHGGLGRMVEYQCTLGAEHLKQHSGVSIDETQEYRQTYGSVPRSRVTQRG